MSIAGSSSLAFSDDDKNKSSKKSKMKFSKQDIKESKMFGSKRKNILIGKKFRKSGKDTGKKGAISAKQEGNKKGSGVSPSMAEFDKMVAEAAKSTKKNKKSMFNRKQFD